MAQRHLRVCVDGKRQAARFTRQPVGPSSLFRECAGCFLLSSLSTAVCRHSLAGLALPGAATWGPEARPRFRLAGLGPRRPPAIMPRGRHLMLPWWRASSRRGARVLMLPRQRGGGRCPATGSVGREAGGREACVGGERPAKSPNTQVLSELSKNGYWYTTNTEVIILKFPYLPVLLSISGLCWRLLRGSRRRRLRLHLDSSRLIGRGLVV